MSAKAVPYFTWIGMNTDTSPPTILSNSVASGSLVPKGTFPITLGYTDTGTAINPSSLIGRIYQWNATGATCSDSKTNISMNEPGVALIQVSVNRTLKA